MINAARRDLEVCQQLDVWATRLMGAIVVFAIGAVLFAVYEVATADPPPRPEPYQFNETGDTP